MSAVLACAVVLAACGGDDDVTDSPSEADDAGSDAVEQPTRGDDGVGEASAEVTIDGVTHRYARVDDVTAFCSSIGGSLQAGLAEIDDAGAPIPDGELTVYLLGPDANPEQHSPPSIQVELSDGTLLGAGDVGFGVETPSVELKPDGRTASGTVQLAQAFEAGTTVDADIEIRC